MNSKTLILCLLMFVFLVPSQKMFAQVTENESTLVEEVVSTDQTQTKKKDKDKPKDVVEINAHFFMSLGLDIATVLIIILLVYYPNYRKMDYIFTFLIFNISIFVLTFVLNKVKISLGAAFGLFAVFAMLRYRTAGISHRDMTYLFIFIALGLVSAIQLELYELGILHGIILSGTFILDGRYIFRRETSKRIRYENMELIRPGNRDALIMDLRNRTGLNVHRVSIEKIDFLKDTAAVTVYYYE